MSTPKTISIYNAARLGATDQYVDPALLSVLVDQTNIKLGDLLPYLRSQNYPSYQVKIGSGSNSAAGRVQVALIRYQVDKGLDKDISNLETQYQNAIKDNSYSRSALGEGGASAQPMQSGFPVLMMLGGLAYFFRKKLHLTI